MSDKVLRDEILRSHRYRTLSSDTTRLLFIHLLLCADSLGNCEATTTAIGDAIGRPVDETTVAKWLEELHDVDIVRVYHADGKRYVHIPRIRQRLRYPQGKHPRPDKNVECPEIRELAEKVRPRSVSGQTKVGLKSAEVKRSEVKRREEKPVRKTSLPAGFAAFWAAYPKKRDQGAAIKAWGKLNPSEDLQAKMLEAIARQRTQPDWIKDGGQFIPYPGAWLNGIRWEDEIPDAKARAMKGAFV